ncbi:hypothetical protein [Stenotrophomonas indicatrix]|uniref:hypothetical protein n=1 Tax=Stenotrophomonas indicatrix TaxID=2045451 RepID=UPI0008B3A1C1|nr:hypothetical protein [Stenotrophomonas indicatrix]SET91620.1 hypothetical protein SAMN05720615_109229 [Stenotrophomonas indicatrix]SEU12525.1 hypothetical protein SAMN05720615_11819 [Stenotrophomonas indicatrix]
MKDSEAIDVAKHLAAAIIASGQYTLTKDLKRDADFANELFFHVYTEVKKVAVP